MNSSRPGVPLGVTVTLVVLAVAVAAGAIAAGVIESGKKPEAKASLTTAAQQPGATYPSSWREKTQDAATTHASQTALPTPEPAPALMPEQPVVPAPKAEPVAPVQVPEPPRRRECPSGAVSARLTSVEFDVENPTVYDIDVKARGVLTNGTPSPIAVGEDDIPNFQGLDDRGQSIVIELYGTYDWAPPPGQPSMGEFILEPGASVAYTAVSQTWKDTVQNVKYWYSAPIPGSLLLSYTGPLVVCEVKGQVPAEGSAIPNSFTD